MLPRILCHIVHMYCSRRHVLYRFQFFGSASNYMLMAAGHPHLQLTTQVPMGSLCSKSAAGLAGGRTLGTEPHQPESNASERSDARAAAAEAAERRLKNVSQLVLQLHRSSFTLPGRD